MQRFKRRRSGFHGLLSQGFKLLDKYISKKKKSFHWGKVTHHILHPKPLVHIKKLKHKHCLSSLFFALKTCKLKKKWHCKDQDIKGLNYGTEVHWYIRYLVINKSGPCHLGIIGNANFLKWYTWFKWHNFGFIIDVNNFEVVYTPTRIEVGEDVTAKLASVHFASSKVSTTLLTLVIWLLHCIPKVYCW